MRGLLVAVAVVVCSHAAAGDPAKPVSRRPASSDAKKAGTGNSPAREKRWSPRRVIAPRALPPPTITLAVLDTSADARQVRLLHDQGLSAYQAGRYDFAVRKFAAAMSGSPTPELVYHAAQAYRLHGDRAKAIELYTQYLELAPEGPAADASRAELDKLRDVPQ